MPRLPILLSCFLLFAASAMAQYSHISGSVSDTLEKKSLSNASILLLRPADSILIAHARSDAAGHFQLNKVPTGHYLLLVTYPSYADYIDEIDAKDTNGLLLPPVPMVLRSKLLETVVVNGNKGAVRIKGDTTEFNADSFRTEAGASVEDLLKKLPGIQVDRNGKITAQGETVKKVLVDGEEFFGDDPTLVTQNLRADMVDKVQVFDKKSDQATFTGIDDGQREKTINLKLKNGKKNGYFGRLTAGTGTDGYYDEELMANYFKNKEKLAAYGIVSNTGKTGLNWQERDNYGQSILGNADVDESTGFITIQNNNDDLDTWSGRFEGQGFPAVKTGGLHFNNKWDDDLQSLNGNYKYMDLAVKGNSTTNTENILPDTFYFNNQRQTFDNRIIRHTVDGTYELKFDSTSSLKIMADGGTDHKTTFNQFTSDYLAADSSLVNSNSRTTSTTGDKRVVNSNFLWRKKLGKVGRTISMNVRENYTDNTAAGYLYSNTNFYQGGAPTGDSLIDQYKNYHTTTTLLDTKATYTEPLSRVSFLVANYGILVNNNHSDRNSYNQQTGGKYTLLDSLYSNNYQYNVFTQRGGLAYSFVKKKFRFSAGTDVGFANFHQRDLMADTTATRHFINWFPTASLAYSFSSMARLSIQYNGITTQPSVTQIQPILTNEDPLNVYIGNPGLKPQFANRFQLFYQDYKVLTDRGIWANVWSTFTPNDISTSSTLDSTGKRTNQYVNVNGTYTINGATSYSWKWKKLDLHPWFGVTADVSNNVSIVNGIPNTTHSGTYGFGPGFWKSKEKKYDFNMDVTFAYTLSKSSINPGVITHYWTYSFSPNGNLYLPLKFQLHADGEINLRQKTSVFDNNNNVVKIDVWLGKKFLKHDQLLIKVAVNDLLNQNIGFNRTVNSNFISQNTYSTIKRFGMISVVWNFNKQGTPVPTNN
ncbi:MAG TPA: outer membrane beta-barrel protein [Puia sp.]|nr:outer membrane beta-barrel protein [Puia sp.]